MKEVADGEVPARMFYYVLDWNDMNGREYMYTQFGKTRTSELTMKEFKQLFDHATQKDSESIG